RRARRGGRSGRDARPSSRRRAIEGTAAAGGDRRRGHRRRASVDARLRSARHLEPRQPPLPAAARCGMTLELDEKSLLVSVPGAATLASIEKELSASSLTLGFPVSDLTVANWLAAGAPGAPTCFADPAEHIVAG